MPLRLPLRCLAVLALWPSLAQAQTPTPSGPMHVEVDSLRALLLTGFERNLQMDLEWIEAVPDSALRWRPVAGVRDLAEQIEHTAVDHALFVAVAILDVPTPAFGDTAVYLNDKAALAEAVTAAYDWVMESLRALTPQDLVTETTLFGQQMPKWRVYLQALEHAYWTRGQTVPYLRMHGVPPPRYRAF